jgi:hypothetical protein
MNAIDALLGDQAGGAVEQLSRQFGLDSSQTSSALGALLPALAAGFQRNASSQDGLGALLGALGSGRHGQYVDDLQSLGSPATIDDGNGILGHIFGSKDVSREVARRASAQSGVGADLLKQMLPVVAAMMMGAMAKKQGGFGPAPGGLGAAFGGQGGGGGILDMLTPMLDSNRDGSAVDDIVGMIGKFMGGR